LESPCEKREKEGVIPVRTLYDCSHARVYGSRIYCDKGYKLTRISRDGSLDINRVEKGMPLVAMAICQSCPDFDCMGNPVLDNEKGWLK